MVILIAITGCSDDYLTDTLPGDDTLHFRVRVPGLSRISVGTRDGETVFDDTAIDKMVVLVFDGFGEDAVLRQDPFEVTSYDQDETTGEIRFNMELDRTLTNPRNTYFVIIANPTIDLEDSLNKDITTVAQMRAVNCGIEEAVTTRIMMSGECRHSDLFGSSGHVVSLRRNVAGVVVKDKESGTLLDFTAYGTPASLSVTTAINPAPAQTPEGAVSASEGVTADGTLFLVPTANTTPEDPYSIDSRPFFVVKAEYAGTYYFYRLPLVETKEDKSEGALDLEANHIYEYEIMEVRGPGYETEAAAASGPPSRDIEYTIHDRQPSIYNMTSDGFNELGITDRVEDMVGEICAKEFYIRCFPSPASPDELEFLVSDDWMEVDQTSITHEIVEDYPGQEATLYKVSLSLKRNPYRTVRTGSVSVAWKGLSVTMEVAQGRSFSADQRSVINMLMYEEDGTLFRKFMKYWIFISGIGLEKDYGTLQEINPPYLYGINPEDNGGVIRTQGLHFPVMNGGRRYVYEVTPDFKASSGATYYEISLRPGSPFESHLEFPKGKLNLGTMALISYKDDSYDLLEETDALRFISYDADGNMVDNITMDLYHVGLFDWTDHSAYRSDRTRDNAIEYGWYYYEVVKFESGGSIDYWLDRNVGARSSGFDITDASGMSIFEGDEGFPFYNGDGRAAGGLYYGIAEVGPDYTDPIIKDDFGPKGYVIPTLSQWNDLRNSRRFLTTQTTTPAHKSYYQAVLDLGTRKVYFPKVGQTQNGFITSEGRMGYYWTTTVATGFEKKEIGKWLTNIVISGNSTYTSSARIENPTTAMSARLVNMSDRNETYYQTVLKVKGVTHVFLYRDNGNNREWPVAWPGTAVSNPDIAYDNYMNFVYESSRDVRYKVLFNFVDDSGAIVTMAQSDAEKGINATGWNAEGTFNFDRTHNLQN